MVSNFAFYFLAFFTVATALSVIFFRNPIYSLLALIGCFFSISGHYLILNAPFLAIVNIIVYAGAIMVLFLFVIRLMNLNVETESKGSRFTMLAALGSGAVLIGVMGVLVVRDVPAGASPMVGQLADIGKILLSEYMIPFEVSSVVFLAATVGAVVLGKKDKKA